VLDYMRKGDLPNFRYEQGRPQFNAISSIPNSVLLHIQLKDFMDEQGHHHQVQSHIQGVGEYR
jgi:hypothetical protein